MPVTQVRGSPFDILWKGWGYHFLTWTDFSPLEGPTFLNFEWHNIFFLTFLTSIIYFLDFQGQLFTTKGIVTNTPPPPPPRIIKWSALYYQELDVLIILHPLTHDTSTTYVNHIIRITIISKTKNNLTISIQTQYIYL